MFYIDGFALRECLHCGSVPKFTNKANYGHVFWRVVCSKCGCGTWCDDNGYGHEDDPGKALAVLEWNQKISG